MEELEAHNKQTNNYKLHISLQGKLWLLSRMDRRGIPQGFRAMHSMCSTVLQRLSSSFQDTTREKTLLVFGNIVYWRENRLVNPQYLKCWQCNHIYDCSFILAHYLELSKGPNSSSAAFFCNQGFILLAAEFFSKMFLESGCY